jgi:hypothetical protein
LAFVGREGGYGGDGCWGFWVRHGDLSLLVDGLGKSAGRKESIPQGLKPNFVGALRDPRLKPLGYLEATTTSVTLK